MTHEATRIDGEIDLARAGEVRDVVTSSLQTESPLVLDLTGVTFMDVAGLRAIWEPTRQIDRSECVVVAVASAPVIRLVDLLGVSDRRVRFVAMGSIAPNRAGSDTNTRWWRSPVFDQMSDPVLVADDQMRYLDANNAATSLLGWSVEAIRELTVADVVAAQHAWTEAEYARFLADGRWRGEVVLRTHGGDSITADAQACFVEGPLRERVFLSVIRQRVADDGDRRRSQAAPAASTSP